MLRTLKLSVLACGLAALVFAVPAIAGEFNKKVNIGDEAPEFAKLPAADGKYYSSTDFEDKDVLVLVVTCNHCPVAVDYEDRVIEVAKKFSSKKDSKVGVIAVNFSNDPSDRLDKMTERAKEKGFNFPYLYDESQELGRALGASKTPEVFVFNKDRKIVYMGALDDDSKNPKTHYLVAAIESVLDGKTPEKAETRAIGCGIRYQKISSATSGTSSR